MQHRGSHGHNRSAGDVDQIRIGREVKKINTLFAAMIKKDKLLHSKITMHM